MEIRVSEWTVPHGDFLNQEMPPLGTQPEWLLRRAQKG